MKSTSKRIRLILMAVTLFTCTVTSTVKMVSVSVVKEIERRLSGNGESTPSSPASPGDATPRKLLEMWHAHIFYIFYMYSLRRYRTYLLVLVAMILFFFLKPLKKHFFRREHSQGVETFTFDGSEIPNNHLGCMVHPIKNINNGRNHLPTG